MLHFLLPLFLGVSPELSTVAEASEFSRTSRYADVVKFLDEVTVRSNVARRSAMGRTTEGRDIPLLILSDPPAASSVEVAAQAASGKLVVFLFGNIHAGEVDGKDALQMLARDIAMGPEKGLLKDLVIMIAPIYNCDGNEKFSPTNRPGQVGPDEMGVRENAHGLDLNRDFIKMEAPETQGLVKLLNSFDPKVVVDCHTTNGSYHRYLITYAGPKAPAGDAELITYAREKWFPGIAQKFEHATPWKTFWYGSFEGAFTDAPRGHTRWETFPAEGRYSTSYVGLRNRMSTLVESYSYATFKDRVLGSYEYCKALLQYAAEHKAEVVAVTRNADDQAVKRGNLTGDSDDVVIQTAATGWPTPVQILGFEEEVSDGHMKNTGREKTYSVELYDRFVSNKKVARPVAYVLRHEPGTESVVAKLRDHGIVVEQLEQDAKLDVEAFTITSKHPASREFQHHVNVTLEAATARGERSFGTGTWLIRSGQPLGTLACYLLEPECEDGLATWNYFDGYLGGKDEYPVYRVMQSGNIPTSKAH